MRVDLTGCINFNVSLPVDLYLKLHRFCRKNKKTKKSVFVEGLERVLSEKVEFKNQKRQGLVRLGDVIPEVMAGLEARCKGRQEAQR